MAPRSNPSGGAFFVATRPIESQGAEPYNGCELRAFIDWTRPHTLDLVMVMAGHRDLPLPARAMNDVDER